MTSLIDLSPTYLATVERILADHVPECEVRAFGSRAAWTAKDYSDLDLAIIGTGPLDRRTLGRLKEAFEESRLPMRVDVLDWHTVPESFRNAIKRGYVVVQEGAKQMTDRAAEGSWLYHPDFPDHWDRQPLYSLAQWVNGLAFRNIQFSPTGKPVIKIAEIKGGISGQTKFTHQDFDESVRVCPGDLLFSWSGQPETSIDAFWWNGPEGWLNQHVFRVTTDTDVDTTFFYYVLRYLKPNFVGIARNKQTTGLGHVTRRDLENMEVGIPPLAEQRAIAHVLGTLDDKIELDRRMNQTLEQMARAIFQDWFVDFGPVRAKLEGREPYLPPELWSLFPDRLVDSELGDIPEGWGVKALGELIELSYGKALKASDRQEGTIPVYGSNGQVGWHNERLVAGPGIVVGRKGNPGVVTWVESDFFPIDTAFYVTPKDESLNLQFLLYSLDGQGLPSIAADSAVPGLNRNLAYMNIQVVPDKIVVGYFKDYISTIFERRHQLEEESRSLAAQRDALLARLVSGEGRGDRQRQISCLGGCI